jgi:Tfp pilus assembly PilM family ATPase
MLQIENNAVKFIDQLEFVDSRYFYLEPKINHKKINEVTELIMNNLKRNNLFTDNIKFVLDSRLAYISCIPLDYSDEVENINSSLIWEISNFFPENYKNYKVTYQKIVHKNKELEHLGNTLIIAYHKNIAEITRRISEISSLKISNINFDVFSAGAYLNNKSNKNFAALGCKKDRIDLSVYSNGKISFFLPVYVKDNAKDVLQTEIYKILKLSGFEEIQDIFLYGDDVCPQILNMLEGFHWKYKIHLTDPFKEYSVESSLLEDRADILNSFSFTPLFGLK